MSPASKRKRQESDDSEDEEGSGRQALPVASSLPKGCNEPMDGMQYLFLVRRDARKLPMVTRVENPYAKAESEQQEPLASEPQYQTHPSLPSEEWRTQFLTRFKNLRKNTQAPGSSSRVLLPERIERDSWWAFIAGQPEEVWSPNRELKRLRAEKKYLKSLKYGRSADKYRAAQQELSPPSSTANPEELYRVTEEGDVELVQPEDPEPSLPTPASTPQIAQLVPDEADISMCIPAVNPREPTPQLLSQLDNRYRIHLLMYFAHWINVYLEEPDSPSPMISAIHLRWVLSLLSKVDDYLTGDEISQLRTLARACTSLIKFRLQRESALPAIKVDDPVSLGACWMVITIVTGFWGQSDLWSDVDRMLITI